MQISTFSCAKNYVCFCLCCTLNRFILGTPDSLSGGGFLESLASCRCRCRTIYSYVLSLFHTNRENETDNERESDTKCLLLYHPFTSHHLQCHSGQEPYLQIIYCTYSYHQAKKYRSRGLFLVSSQKIGWKVKPSSFSSGFSRNAPLWHTARCHSCITGLNVVYLIKMLLHLYFFHCSFDSAVSYKLYSKQSNPQRKMFN